MSEEQVREFHQKMLVDEAVEEVDRIVLRSDCTGQEMLYLTVLIARAVVEKVAFHVRLDMERERIAKELGPSLG